MSRIRNLSAPKVQDMRNATRRAATRSTRSGDESLPEIISRLEAVEESLGGEVWDRLGAHELALEVAEAIFKANELDVITWRTSGSSWVARDWTAPATDEYRVTVSLVLDGLQTASTGRVWARVRRDSTALVTSNNLSAVVGPDGQRRHSIQLDFNAEQGDSLDVQVAVHGGIQGGRFGWTQPAVTTPTWQGE